MDFLRNFHKASGMPTHLDSIFFHWSGPSLMPTRLSAPVSGVYCHCPSFLANCLLSPFVSLSDWRPLTTSGHVEITDPKPFVWFRARTDKGIVCLADILHSVTYLCFWLKISFFSAFISSFFFSFFSFFHLFLTVFGVSPSFPGDDPSHFCSFFFVACMSCIAIFSGRWPISFLFFFSWFFIDDRPFTPLLRNE